MALSDGLNAVSNSISGVGTAFTNKQKANESAVGNDRGVVSVSGSMSLSGDVFGFVYQAVGTLSTDITTALPAADPANKGKRLTFYNPTASHNWTLTAGNFSSSYGVGVSSITLPPLSSIILEHDGVSYNAIGGTGVIGPTTTVSSASPTGGKSGDIWYQV
jgi:hypothetical protein